MIKQSFPLVLISLVVLVPAILIFIFKFGATHHFQELPVYGHREFSPSGDTIYHSIIPFSFTNQQEETVTNDKLLGNMVVANFFFSSCPGSCLSMTKKLAEMQDFYADRKDLRFASFTVDPARDNASRLKAYGQEHGTNPLKWDLLTGDKAELYKVARKGFLVNADDNPEVTDIDHDFIHSEHFILLDKEGRIRGYYFYNDEDELKRLKDEIVLLALSYDKQ